MILFSQIHRTARTSGQSECEREKQFKYKYILVEGFISMRPLFAGLAVDNVWNSMRPSHMIGGALSPTSLDQQHAKDDDATARPTSEKAVLYLPLPSNH